MAKEGCNLDPRTQLGQSLGLSWTDRSAGRGKTWNALAPMSAGRLFLQALPI